MKTINVTFEDEEYEALIKKKGKLTWRQFILKLAEGKRQRSAEGGHTFAG